MTIEFDAQWYLDTYPDVGLTGLAPEEHFNSIGRAMGRPGSAAAAARPGGDAPRRVAPVTSERPGPIIHRPADLDRQGGRVRSPSDKMPMPEAHGLCLGGVEVGRFRTAAELQRCLAPVAAHGRLLTRQPGQGESTRVEITQGGESRALTPTDLAQGPLALSSSGVFQDGVAALENTWFAAGSLLRLMLADRPRAEQAGSELVLRAYQADTFGAAGLTQLGAAMALSPEGPCFLDLPLISPLAPVLLDLSDAQGFTLGLALLPFPSLLPGGLHSAELKALQARRHPMESFWRLSHSLLASLLRPGPGRIGALTVETGGATGAEYIFQPEVQNWLALLFGLRVGPVPQAPGGAGRGETWLQTSLATGAALDPELNAALPAAADAALGLRLPATALPTLSALVAPQLAAGLSRPETTGPLLIAESVNMKARWSLSLPSDLADLADQEGLAVLTRSAATAPADRSVDDPVPVPMHLAIIYRPDEPVRDPRVLMPQAPDIVPDMTADAAADLPPLTVLLSAAEATQTASFLQSLAGQRGLGPVELLVRLPEDEDTVAAIVTALDQHWPGAYGTLPGQAADLLSQAADATARDLVLLAEDRILLQDPHCLATLVAQLQADPQALSASCVLLGETEIKKKSVLQASAGGIFPSRVSFAAAPALSFEEPEVLQALPLNTYPVVANRLSLLLLRRRILAELPLAATGAESGFADPDADLRLGLQALTAGYRSLCTSRVRAGIQGVYARRDEIDPFASDAMTPGSWQDVLSRVTVLRELF